MCKYWLRYWLLWCCCQVISIRFWAAVLLLLQAISIYLWAVVLLLCLLVLILLIYWCCCLKLFVGMTLLLLFCLLMFCFGWCCCCCDCCSCCGSWIMIYYCSRRRPSSMPFCSPTYTERAIQPYLRRWSKSMVRVDWCAYPLCWTEVAVLVVLVTLLRLWWVCGRTGILLLVISKSSFSLRFWFVS